MIEILYFANFLWPSWITWLPKLLKIYYTLHLYNLLSQNICIFSISLLIQFSHKSCLFDIDWVLTKSTQYFGDLHRTLLGCNSFCFLVYSNYVIMYLYPLISNFSGYTFIHFQWIFIITPFIISIVCNLLLILYLSFLPWYDFSFISWAFFLMILMLW